MIQREARRLDRDFTAGPNSLNAVRLGLAALVVVGHSWQLGGYGEEPHLGTTYFSTWALYGFFTISGFLILRSRLSRRSAGEFYWARFLRIYPGFLVCLVAIAFVFAPISRLLDDAGGYDPLSAVKYVARNVLLYTPGVHQEGIANTLSTVPFSRNWDEPMWSLFYEASCYVLVGLLVTLLPRRALRSVIPVLFVLSTAFTFLSVTGRTPLPYAFAIALTLLTPFLAGSTLWILGPWLPAARWDVLLSAAALFLVILSGYTAVFSALPLAHLLIRLGGLLPLSGVGRRWDISYGVYIYGVPVQQIVVLAFPHRALPVPAYIAAVLLVLLPLAFASSALIEMPALRMKTWRPWRGRRAGREPRPALTPRS